MISSAGIMVPWEFDFGIKTNINEPAEWNFIWHSWHKDVSNLIIYPNRLQQFSSSSDWLVNDLFVS